MIRRFGVPKKVLYGGTLHWNFWLVALTKTSKYESFCRQMCYCWEMLFMVMLLNLTESLSCNFIYGFISLFQVEVEWFKIIIPLNFILVKCWHVEGLIIGLLLINFNMNKAYLSFILDKNQSWVLLLTQKHIN